MSDTAKEERRWTSDIVWVALYSSLLFLLMVAWANIPGWSRLRTPPMHRETKKPRTCRGFQALTIRRNVQGWGDPGRPDAIPRREACNQKRGWDTRL